MQVNEEPRYAPVTTQLLPGETSISLLCHHLPSAEQGEAAELPPPRARRRQRVCRGPVSPNPAGSEEIPAPAVRAMKPLQ